MIPAALAHKSLMENQDLFSRLGGGDDQDCQDTADDLASFGGGADDLTDPFNDSDQDLFEKLMQESVTKNSSSLGNNMMSFFNASEDVSNSNSMFIQGESDAGRNSQSLLESALTRFDDALIDNDPGGAIQNMETDEDVGSNSRMQNQTWNMHPSRGLTTDYGSSLSETPATGNQQQNWILENIVESPAIRKDIFSSSSQHHPILPSLGSTTLDAAPLNISLGGTGGITSTLRRKGSNAQMNSMSKSNLVVRASKTSTKLKSSKSEGLLARALKAKYNSSSQLSAYNVNAEQAAAVIAKAQGSMSNVLSTSRTGSAMLGNSPSMHSMGTGEGASSGTRNASWRTVPDGAASSSMLQHVLLNKNRSSNQLQSTDSTSSLFKAKLKLGSSSKSSMQDLLRLSRKQSQTQSMLRQSSARSLLRQTSSKSMKDVSAKVDVSSLLPPEHAHSRKSLLSVNNVGGGSRIDGSRISSNASFPMIGGNSMSGGSNSVNRNSGLQTGSMQTESLLHQSCRLYPTTDAVVDSALRIDPDAIRRAVATTVDQGSANKASSVYGYPINVALTNGASMGVLKLLVQAGPDVLIQKDGTDGSGSLGIALSTKCDLAVVDLLIDGNPECVRVADRRGNYPLHVAVNYGLPLQIVRRLCMVYPKAQEMRNFHSQTPLDLAQRSTRCPEEVMNFLQSSAYSNLESSAHHIDRNPRHLEDGLDDIMRTNF